MQKPSVMDKIKGAVSSAADAVFNQPSSREKLEILKQQNRDDANGVMRENIELDRIKSLTSKVLKG
jgi:hypothetical protein